MTLGCTLPDSFLNILKAIYAKVGLMRDALRQMEPALGPNGFKNGTPYDFGSLSREEQNSLEKCSPLEDRLHPYSDLVNVPAPNDAATEEMLKPEADKVKALLIREKDMIKAIVNKGVQACKTCAAGRSEDGSTLKTCKDCGVVKYCGKKCQKADFAIHKDVCFTLVKFSERGVDDSVFVGFRMLPPNWKDEFHKLKAVEGELEENAAKLKDMLNTA